MQIFIFLVYRRDIGRGLAQLSSYFSTGLPSFGISMENQYDYGITIFRMQIYFLIVFLDVYRFFRSDWMGLRSENDRIG